MLNLLWQLAISAAIGLAFFVIGNLYLATMSNVNPYVIWMSNQLRKLALAVPRTAIFSSRNRTITGLAYDSNNDKEIEFYKGRMGLPFFWLVPWSGSNRPGAKVARRAVVDLSFRGFLLATIAIPSLVIVAWLGVTQHWIWFLLLAVLLSHQIVVWITRRAIFLKPGAFSAFAFLVLLHRTSVLPISWTWCVILLATWCVVSFGLTPWLASDD